MKSSCLHKPTQIKFCTCISHISPLHLILHESTTTINRCSKVNIPLVRMVFISSTSSFFLFAHVLLSQFCYKVHYRVHSHGRTARYRNKWTQFYYWRTGTTTFPLNIANYNFLMQEVLVY